MKTVIFTLTLLSVIFFPVTHSLGSSSTISITSSTSTVCGIVASESNQRIACYQNNQTISIIPNVSYQSVSGGLNFFCGLKSDGFSFFCWDNINITNTAKRIYFNDTVGLRDLTVGGDHVCGIDNTTEFARCWWRGGSEQTETGRYLSLNESVVSVTSGNGFSCAITNRDRAVKCWGSRNSTARVIESEFLNMSMVSLVAGDSHVCGVNLTGVLVCKGSNSSGQLGVPGLGMQFEFGKFALGVNHTCAIRRLNGSVVCWGGGGRFSSSLVDGVSFEIISAGLDFTCGLTTANLSLICWGPGWSNSNFRELPLPKIVPGPCTQGSCSCGIYTDSQTLCSGFGTICKPCEPQILSPPALPPPIVPLPSPPVPKRNNRGLLIFGIVGSVGIFIGICTIVYCLWTGVCCKHKKVHNSVQPTITGSNTNPATFGSDHFSPQFSRSSTIRRQSSRAMRRQRSGTSSKHTDRAEEFTLAELAAATNHFSMENKLGAGSFGTVYKGKFPDGREVAIKRGDTSLRMKKFQEKESAFQSELAFLSRLHHKHLVGLVGFCEEKDERLLVYEYMKNGALYDHLHSRNNVDKSSSVVNSWKMRIKISLDAARGIEYLHSYAVPPIIHRDIKSSNILLDANWVARVSDFGLSLMGPEFDGEYMPTKAAGTVGYMDPEYYGLNVLTSKSDVYGLGVVLLELLTGKRAIFKSEEGGGSPISVVDYAVQKIITGELGQVLDPRVGHPELKEAEAVELVAYIAASCVNMEGKERPSMTDIVANLERAITLCDDSHGSISSATFSIISE